MTLPRLNALTKHWAKSPPVHITAALFAGIETTAPARPAASESVVLVNPLREMHGDPRKMVWQAKPNG